MLRASVIVSGAACGLVIAGTILATSASAGPSAGAVRVSAPELSIGLPAGKPERDTDPNNSPFDHWEVRDGKSTSGSATAGSSSSRSGAASGTAGSAAGSTAAGADGDQELADTGFDAAATASLGLFTFAVGLGMVRLSRRRA